MTNKDKIAKKLRELLDLRDYTYPILEMRSGVHRKSLQAYHTGRNGVPLDNLEKIVKVYGYSVSDFLKEIEDDRQN